MTDPRSRPRRRAGGRPARRAPVCRHTRCAVGQLRRGCLEHRDPVPAVPGSVVPADLDGVADPVRRRRGRDADGPARPRQRLGSRVPADAASTSMRHAAGRPAGRDDRPVIGRPRAPPRCRRPGARLRRRSGSRRLEPGRRRRSCRSDRLERPGRARRRRSAAVRPPGQPGIGDRVGMDLAPGIAEPGGLDSPTHRPVDRRAEVRPRARPRPRTSRDAMAR